MERIEPDALQGSFHPTWFHAQFPPSKVGHLCCGDQPEALTDLGRGRVRPHSCSSFQKLTVAADVSVVPLVSGKAAVKLMIVQIKSC